MSLEIREMIYPIEGNSALAPGGTPFCMTSEERERMFALCERIAVEKDHAKFLQLVVELNRLFESREGRLRGGGAVPADRETE